MSTYIYGKVLARGNTKILEEFVSYFEGEYDDKEQFGQIKENNSKWLDSNSYLFEGTGNYLWVDIQEISIKFPALKFEYTQKCSDGQSVSNYMICLNGDTLDCGDGNCLAFGIYEDSQERCRMCNSELDYAANFCGECHDFCWLLSQ